MQDETQPHVVFSFVRWLIAGGVAFIAILALWIMAANILVVSPYYRMDAYTVEPPAVCPSAPVSTVVDRTLTPSPLLVIGSYDLYPSWINVASGQIERLPASGGTLADNLPGRLKANSLYLRMAPTTPGRWRLHVDMTLRGRVLGWPRDWPISYESEDLLTVLDPTSRECR